jgi:uridine kinase
MTATPASATTASLAEATAGTPAPLPVSRAKNVVMASHGRAPWYTPDGRGMDAYVIGIAGGSASGKVSSGGVDADVDVGGD